jgi:hypothetical protein
MMLSMNTIKSYVAATRSYFQFNDIDIVIAKFKRKVKMPKYHREDEEALDAADIRKILLSCSNRRLKPYLLVLASGGLRAREACAIRLCDIDFNLSPTKVHVRKEYAKTRVARDVYISDEATRFLREWIKWKYSHNNKQKQLRTPNENDLVFAFYKEIVDTGIIYDRIREQFVKVLNSVGFGKRKEGMLRRLITLHSFRRHVKTVISDQVSMDYSEWFLGHSKSPYYTMKEPMRREIYATKCMRYLTYLDYSALEHTGKNIEKKLEAREDEIQSLREQLNSYETRLKQYDGWKYEMDELRKMVMKGTKEASQLSDEAYEIAHRMGALDEQDQKLLHDFDELRKSGHSKKALKLMKDALEKTKKSK